MLTLELGRGALDMLFATEDAETCADCMAYVEVIGGWISGRMY